MGALVSGFQEAMMPRGPKGKKRPADVIGNAVHVMHIATGEIEEIIPDDGKDSAAKALGRKGGAARAKSMTPERRAEIAKKRPQKDGISSHSIGLAPEALERPSLASEAAQYVRDRSPSPDPP
jgi:hypothetical protein